MLFNLGMTKIILSLIVVSTCLFTSKSFASSSISPLAIGILPPIQFPSDEFTITGFRLSALWGRHRDIYGLDFGGLGNITDQAFTGVGIAGLTNITHGQATIIALQFAGVLNMATQKMEVYGLQVAGGLNMLQAESKVVGLQLALLGNVAPNTNVYGVQIGLYNRARAVYGFQIGLVNFAKDLHGIQIGLINFNETGIFGISPIINVGF